MLLYIHIPFCDSKCSYCAFNSYVDKFHLKAEYMKALMVQLEHELERFSATPNSIETVFIGGGTPSTIPPQLYIPLFEKIQPFLACDAEITTEANPNSATKEWLEGMRNLGLNRVSFGVQSFDAEKLKLLHRAHNASQAKEAILHAKEVGFENISCDLIYATAGDTKELLENDIKTAFSLPINHLSAYALTIEENTPFEKTPQMSQESLKLTQWIFETIKEHGFDQYEISNFGIYQSKHNLGYWRYKDYIGLGCGAVGKLGNQRLYPHTGVEEYIHMPKEITIEELSDEDVLLEKIFLGLRSCVGVEKSLLNIHQIAQAEILVEENKLTCHNDTFYNPDYLLADEIALYLSS